MYDSPSENTRFFFGRSVKTQPRAIKTHKSGTFQYTQDDFVYFHTNLDAKNLNDKIFMVIECVIIAERKDAMGGIEKKYLSGGYAKHKIFPLEKSSITIDLLLGTPRALLSKGHVTDKWDGAQLDLKITKYKEFDALKQLVGINTFVAQSNLIPGLKPVKDMIDQFPAPSKEDKESTQLETLEKTHLYFHEISIASSSINIEEEVKKILAQAYIDR